MLCIVIERKYIPLLCNISNPLIYTHFMSYVFSRNKECPNRRFDNSAYEIHTESLCVIKSHRWIRGKTTQHRMYAHVLSFAVVSCLVISCTFIPVLVNKPCIVRPNKLYLMMISGHGNAICITVRPSLEMSVIYLLFFKMPWKTSSAKWRLFFRHVDPFIIN